MMEKDIEKIMIEMMKHISIVHFISGIGDCNGFFLYVLVLLPSTQEYGCVMVMVVTENP